MRLDNILSKLPLGYPPPPSQQPLGSMGKSPSAEKLILSSSQSAAANLPSVPARPPPPPPKSTTAVSTAASNLPSEAVPQIKLEVTLEDLISKEDPNGLFTDMQILGQGYDLVKNALLCESRLENNDLMYHGHLLGPLDQCSRQRTRALANW